MGQPDVVYMRRRLGWDYFIYMGFENLYGPKLEIHQAQTILMVIQNF
jgi:hypothetical protein